MLSKLKTYLLSGDQRTALAKRNIIGSIALKFIDVLIDFIIVPLSLAYLTQTDYGIWLMINSVVNWLNLFDIGISHGYRNKLAVALSDKDFTLAKAYTSTAYGIIGLISFIIIVFSLLVIPIVNWSRALNAPEESNQTLTFVLLIVVITFALRLTLKVVTSVFLANQLPFLKSLMDTIIKVLTAGGIIGLMFLSKNNLLLYSIIFSIAPLIVLLVSTIIFFNTKYKHFRPSISTFDKKKINELMGLSIKFFIIQMGATMLFMTDNLIIAHVLSPADVAPYQIAQKYFGVILIISTIILTPFWSATTEAYSKKEYGWIRKSIKSLNKIWFIGVLFSMVLFSFFQSVLLIWVGAEIKVPMMLSIQCVLFVSLLSYSNIYTFFLNGTGKILLQMITGIITIVINIPLSIYFALNLNMGSSGVLLATNCSILLYIILRKIQYHKLINNKANGIWNR